MSIGDRVRERRKALHMNQGALSKAVSAQGGSLSQAQISALEAGTVRRPHSLPELAAALRTTTDWLIHGKDANRSHSTQNKSDKILTDVGRAIVAAADPLLVWRSAPGLGRSGETMVYKEQAGAVTRPVELAYSKEAFAFKVIDDEAEPRYERRDLLLIDPGSAPAPGDDCFFIRDEHSNPLVGVARRLLRITPDHWVIRKFGANSPEVKLSRSEWSAAWPIFGSYNRR